MSLNKLLLVGVAAATLTGCFTYQEPPQWKLDLTNMAYSTDFKSTEVTQIEDTSSYDPIDAVFLGGRVRVARFFWSGTADITSGQTVALALIPKNCRITMVNINYLFAGGNADSVVNVSTIKASDGTAATKFSAVSVLGRNASSVTNSELVPNALGTSTKTTEDVVVIGTVATNDSGSSTPIIWGDVYYVQN